MSLEIKGYDLGKLNSFSQGIIPWLAKTEWTKEQLWRLLQGYDFPVVGYYQEPYIGLGLGLEAVDINLKQEASLVMASRLAVLLYDRPDVKLKARRATQALYNALLLAANLKAPEQLSDPLHDIYNRRSLSGHYLAVDLRLPLTAALIANQVDTRYSDVWKQMLEGRKEGFLSSDVYIGFDGMVAMPESRRVIGQLNVERVTFALEALVDYIDRDDFNPNVRAKQNGLSLLYRTLVKQYKDDPRLHFKLHQLEHESKVPQWATEVLFWCRNELLMIDKKGSLGYAGFNLCLSRSPRL